MRLDEYQRQVHTFTDKDKKELISKIADCLGYIAKLATVLDVSLSHVAAVNLVKLTDRKARDKIKGSGDDR